jgi:hypothetical protein
MLSEVTVTLVISNISLDVDTFRRSHGQVLCSPVRYDVWEGRFRRPAGGAA